MKQNATPLADISPAEPEEISDCSFVPPNKQALIRSEQKFRRLAGLTQTELAKQMGTTQANISLFERGIYNPTLAYLQKMAVALGKELVIEFK